MSREPAPQGERPRVSDEQLDDWYRRWPSSLPTSVPHSHVKLLIEDYRDVMADLRDCRAAVTEAREQLRRVRAQERERWQQEAAGDDARCAHVEREARREVCEQIAAMIEHDEISVAGNQPLKDCKLSERIRELTEEK